MVQWLKEAELNEEMKSTMGSKSGNSRGSKVNMEEKATEENSRLAEVIAASNYADQKMKMEYDRKEVRNGRMAKAKA